METKTERTEEAIHDLIRQYLDAREEVRRREEQLEQEKENCRSVEERLAKAMVFRGVRSQRLLDGSTIYLAPEVHLSKRAGVATEELIDALRASGLEDLVSETYQVRSLQAWAKENWERSRGNVDVAGGATSEDWDASLPAPLQGMLNLYQRTRVRVRNAPTQEDMNLDDLEKAALGDEPLV